MKRMIKVPSMSDTYCFWVPMAQSGSSHFMKRKDEYFLLSKARLLSFYEMVRDKSLIRTFEREDQSSNAVVRKSYARIRHQPSVR